MKDFPGKIPALEHLILIEGKGDGSMEALEAAGRAQPVKSIRPRADEIASLLILTPRWPHKMKITG